MSLLHSADNVHRHSVIPTENLVDLNVVLFGLRTSGVPTNNFLAAIDAAHHIEHFCSKLINQPKLTVEQWNTSLIGGTIVIVR